MSEEKLHDTIIVLLKLTNDLLKAVSDCDWKRYAELCHPSLTCFEPESNGLLVKGLDFHKFYFDNLVKRGTLINLF
jgi:calcium/calmodulin-dependent protein kinase (CaM kinase) II